MKKDLTTKPGHFVSSAEVEVMCVPMIPKNKSELAVKEFLEKCDTIAIWCGGYNTYRNHNDSKDTSIQLGGCIQRQLYYDEMNDSMYAYSGQYIVVDANRDKPTRALSEWELDREFRSV